MTWFEAVILGMIQGLTEFLPISSTAHLKVIPSLLGWKDPGAAFTAVTQWGTWLATVVYFRHDLLRILAAFFHGLITLRPLATQEARLAWMIALGTIPIVVMGVLLKKQIEGSFRSLYVIAAALIGLALLLSLAEWLTKLRQESHHPATEIENLGFWQALVIGLAQAVALVPGASRSGSTITGALFVGLSRSAAARYSFLLSLPAIFGAGLYQFISSSGRAELLQTEDSLSSLLIATVVAGIVGYAAIAWLIAYLRTRSTWGFIFYRLILGLILLWLLQLELIEP
jgi:undecaprenyl-diphosphatase